MYLQGYASPQQGYSHAGPAAAQHGYQQQYLIAQAAQGAYSAPALAALGKGAGGPAGQYYAASPVSLARPGPVGQYYATPIAIAKGANPIGQYYAPAPVALAKAAPAAQYYASAGGYDTTHAGIGAKLGGYSQPALIQTVYILVYEICTRSYPNLKKNP